SGTNVWHGSGFDHIRNDALDANDWFNNRYGVAKPIERQQDFGGTVGGALTVPGGYSGKGRTFFFASDEGLRLQQPLPATVTYVPTVDLRRQAAPALQSWANAFPLPGGTGVAPPANLPNGLAQLVYTDSLPSHLDSTSLRFDHSITP